MNAGPLGIPARSRRRAARIVAIALAIPMLLLWGCDYGHMMDDEAIQTYERTLPQMPKKTIPVDGGVQVLREANPLDLQNPLPQTVQVVERGRERYGFYCIQCHGTNADGFGTVGQSFAPLPANLADKIVQSQTDGEIFYKISLGYNRHPPLYYTVTPDDRWAIVRYIRSLAGRSSG
jgi:mono/diheme cytochrome c family protein